MPPSRSRSPPGDVTSSSALGRHGGRAPSPRRLLALSVLRHAPKVTAKGSRLRYLPPTGRPLAPLHRLLRDRSGRAVVPGARGRRGASAGPRRIARLTHGEAPRNARRIEAAILRLRGLFIKVGQLISIMANFLPDAFREELQRLQDQVPPRPYEDIEARLREEFGGRGPTEVFAEFSPRAGGLGVDRPGPPRAPAHGRGGGGQGSVPRHRGDCPHRPAGAASASSASCAGSCPTTASTPSTARSARWCWPSSTTAARRRPSSASRPTSRRARATNVALPARHRASSRRRACSPPSGWTGIKVADLERLEERDVDRRAAGAPLRRGLLPADLHRRPLSRRSAPREPAGAAARRPGGDAHGRLPRLRRDGHGVARGCGAGWSRSFRARSRATRPASSAP